MIALSVLLLRTYEYGPVVLGLVLVAVGRLPAERSQAHPGVNVAYSGSSQWLSLAGSAEVVRDQAKKKDLWNTFTEAWFTDGDTDPSMILIHVMADPVQYWESPGKLVTLVSMIEAKMTGAEPEAGDSASVEL